MTVVIIVLLICVSLEGLVIVELLKQRRQIALQLKLLRQAWEWRMNSNEGKETDCR